MSASMQWLAQNRFSVLGERICEGLDELPELFWITGFGLLQILFISCFVRRDEAGEWTQYLAMAGILPAAVLTIALIQRFLPTTLSFFRCVRLLLAMIGLGLSFYFLRSALCYLVLLVACSQCVLLLVLSRIRQGREETVQNPAWWYRGVISLLILIPAWAAASRLTWWSPFSKWITDSPLAMIIFIPFLVLIPIGVCDCGLRDQKLKWRLFTIPNALATILLGLASLRSDGASLGYIHGAAIIGPAELVRQGGWLLWDVPSQYGFLNTLLLAVMPCDTAWQSLYVLHSLLLFLASTILFLFFRLSGQGRLN